MTTHNSFHLGRWLRWCVTLVVAAWLAGLLVYAQDIPDRVSDSSTPTDAIVVLTGGSERLEEGLNLLRQHMGRKLFVSGVHRGVDVADLLRLSGQKTDGLECCIALGYAADNTMGNALETAAWMRAEGFSSLRLVTGNYHMRRSLFEFHRAMPDATIVAHPVFPDAVKRNQWWTSPGTAHLIASEYVKYLAAQFRTDPGL
jgi:uncharacterized SAM-binding protein YcdF (DUF218 family)